MAIGWVVRLNEYKLQRTSDLDNLKILARSKMLARRRNTQTESPERSFTCLDDIQKDRSFNFFREFLLNQVVTNIRSPEGKIRNVITHSLIDPQGHLTFGNSFQFFWSLFVPRGNLASIVAATLSWLVASSQGTCWSFVWPTFFIIFSDLHTERVAIISG